MKTSDFNFDLPENLIAQSPTAQRGQSRLMVLNRETGGREHRMVSDLPLLLEKGTLLVFNNSRVRKARIFGVSESTGAQTEFLLLKRLDDFVWLVLTKRTKRKKPGSSYIFDDAVKATISAAGIDAEGELTLRFDRPIDDDWLDRFGHIPLPPYINRKDTEMDSRRYQTVYASQTGSVAAPTAGLHFTEETLTELDNAGMEMVFITLHVGLGTFLPVRTLNVEDHVMHEEAFCIGEEEAGKIEKAKKEKRKILAVGTTSLRTLEAAWQDGLLKTQGSSKSGRPGGGGVTSIFIHPGFQFRITDMLFTNFHTPMSTLLMLVSAFAETKATLDRNNDNTNSGYTAGRNLVLESYQEAIKEGYRFFSYGDAMLIL